MAAIRILVAEDNDLVALTLEEQLKSIGYDVIAVAHTGAEAIDLATRLSPDLIIMDIRMPEVEGTEAAARINTISSNAHPYADRLHRPRDHSSRRGGGRPGLPGQASQRGRAVASDQYRAGALQGATRLRAQVTDLEDLLEARKLIERAKGILMQRLGLSERDAYERLRQRARDKRAKMKDIAQAIIEAEELLGA